MLSRDVLDIAWVTTGKSNSFEEVQQKNRLYCYFDQILKFVISLYMFCCVCLCVCV